MRTDYQILLHAIGGLGPLTTGQASRFLYDTGLLPQGDIAAFLTEAKDEGYLRQAIAPGGIVYDLTAAGKDALAAHPLEGEVLAKVNNLCVEYQRLFEKEKNYLAQYTESSTAIVPVFLSIRDGAKILLKVSVLVEDQESAKEITAQWMDNADKAYKAIWDCIGGGRRMPEFPKI